MMILIILITLPLISADSANETLLKNVTESSSKYTTDDYKLNDGYVFVPEAKDKTVPIKNEIITSIAKALQDFFKSLGL